MLLGQKHTGRGLFPFGSSSRTDNGQTTPLALLGAVSFVVQGPEDPHIISWAEPALAARVLDCSPSSLPISHAVFHGMLPHQSQRVRQNAIDGLSYDGARYIVQYQILRDENEIVWIEETGERLKGHGVKPTHILGVLRDINTPQIFAATSISNMPSGCIAEHKLYDLLRHAQTLGHPTQVVQVQIQETDFLKQTYGFKAMDYVIRSVAERLSGQVSPTDYIAFDENEHFKIYYPDLSANQLLERSKKLKYILGIPVESPFGALKPQLKTAIKTVPKVSRDIQSGMREQSTGLMFESKPAKTITEVDIMIALEQNRFRLAFQPIKSAGGRETKYHEALLRVQNDQGELETAFPYIIAAEKIGLIDQLDRRAFALARQNLREHSSLKLALNVSAGTISDNKARNAYLTDLSALGKRASDVIIELTETMAMENTDQINLFSAQVQSTGAKLAIDDFGAGHTSFDNLMGIEAQILKLDGSLIRDIARDPKKQNFVRLLTEMAQVLGLETVAEMIDNEADALMAERMGVDYLQGFWLGRPDTL